MKKYFINWQTGELLQCKNIFIAWRYWYETKKKYIKRYRLGRCYRLGG